MEAEGSRVRALIEALFDAYYDWDIASGREDFSEAMDVLLGLRPGEFPRTFAAWAERLHPDDRGRALGNVDRFARKAGVYADEYRLRREDGAYVLVSDRGVTLQDDSGHPTHMIGVIRDITRQREAERALRESQESLRLQATALEESNIALRVILEQRARDRDELAGAITANVEQMILPMLARLERSLAGSPELVYLQAAAQTLRDIAQPIATSFTGNDAFCPVPLTPREREIANLIRVGKTSDEIAAALYISPATVAFHRKNLRRKLGLGRHDSRLVTHLGRLTTDPSATRG
jgi:PAS domain S-box-containing protein